MQGWELALFFIQRKERANTASDRSRSEIPCKPLPVKVHMDQRVTLIALVNS